MKKVLYFVIVMTYGTTCWAMIDDGGKGASASAAQAEATNTGWGFASWVNYFVGTSASSSDSYKDGACDAADDATDSAAGVGNGTVPEEDVVVDMSAIDAGGSTALDGQECEECIQDPGSKACLERKRLLRNQELHTKFVSAYKTLHGSYEMLPGQELSEEQKKLKEIERHLEEIERTAKKAESDVMLGCTCGGQFYGLRINQNVYGAMAPLIGAGVTYLVTQLTS